MNASYIALEVSFLIEQLFSTSDTSSATKTDLEAMKKRALKTIYIS